jgi:hypothetical protein
LGLGGWQPKCHFKVSEEGEHQAKQLEAYSAFLAEKAEEQAGIENNRIFKLKFKARQLEIFDHEESHLDQLRVYFNEPTLEDWLKYNSHHRN